MPDEAHLLLEETASRVSGPLTVILERDGAFPSIEALVAELNRIRADAGSGTATAASGHPRMSAESVEAFLARLLADCEALSRFETDRSGEPPGQG